ncbi:Serine/threonine-protein phosphatase 2A activator 1 [Elasticomyces elasticus]|nr:Serine/threonine-protein phosphatase 2A activator 1 [Elasticomyces elasticus]
MSTKAGGGSVLEPVGANVAHRFMEPVKRINDGADVDTFLTTEAYEGITSYLTQLNRSMIPCEDRTEPESFSDPVQRVAQLVLKLQSLVAEAPPESGPRRFGNVAFRKWHACAEQAAPSLLEDALPDLVTQTDHAENKARSTSARTEIQAYLLGSFGSPQRLDYGTGHELSFLAFLGCIWKLNGFATNEPGVEERGVVLGIIQPYLNLVRILIKTYNLEPAGSHGVWGLDDHSFLPYIFGSAQLSPSLPSFSSTSPTPTEGSAANAPLPPTVTDAKTVAQYRESNMYFSAIGFIYDVKRGPFWEHSPILYNISGIKDGWAKINKGMLKMYNAEVLSKFPVVQHFPFGSLFSWKENPKAFLVPGAQRVSQPTLTGGIKTQDGQSQTPREIRAPWATNTDRSASPITAAPWASATAAVNPTGRRPVPGVGTKAPWTTTEGAVLSTGASSTAAPWASRGKAANGRPLQ